MVELQVERIPDWQYAVMFAALFVAIVVIAGAVAYATTPRANRPF